MKPLFRLWSVFLFLPLLIGSGRALAGSIAAVTEEMPPFNHTENGKVTGMATEVVREALDRSDLPATFLVYPWKRAYQIALRQPNVLIYSIGRNPDREKQFQWVGVIAPVNMYFFKLRDRDQIQLESVADAKQYKIGAVSGDYTLNFLRAQGFPEAGLDVTGAFNLNFRKLFERRVDLVLVDELTAASLIRSEAAMGRPYRMDKLERALFVAELSTGMYMAFSLGTPAETVEKTRTALESLKKDGTYQAILDRYRAGR
ncbi:MAG: substrate-binding periplasmic protein [Desulfococcaceae bacterium]